MIILHMKVVKQDHYTLFVIQERLTKYWMVLTAWYVNVIDFNVLELGEGKNSYLIFHYQIYVCMIKAGHALS